MTPRAADELRQSEYVSETPCFDGLFARYDMGQGYVLLWTGHTPSPTDDGTDDCSASASGSFGTEHLGSLLLDMGFNCAPRQVLYRALDGNGSPTATGEISKLTVPRVVRGQRRRQ
ncbi:hypothetical protein PINS_up018462 [Pythium insidiosum]|nr:hypothetical protein PINS_up018462 [Pythium insidiosum]